MHAKVLSDELCEKFTNLVGLKSYREIADELGVSKAVVYKMSVVTGKKPTEQQKKELKMKASEGYHNDEVSDKIKELWDTHSTRQIAEKVGLTRGGVMYAASRLGLKRTPEKAVALLSEAVAKQNKMDRVRMHFGMEQKTNRRLCADQKLSVKRQKIRNRLRNYGYKIDQASLDVHVTKDTRRLRMMETRAKALQFRFHYDEGVKNISASSSLWDHIAQYINDNEEGTLIDLLNYLDRVMTKKYAATSVTNTLGSVAKAGFIRREKDSWTRIKSIPFEVDSAEVRRMANL